MVPVEVSEASFKNSHVCTTLMGKGGYNTLTAVEDIDI